MRIVVTNDDGVASTGLWALAEAVQATGIGEVLVVAPHEERSGAGMSFPPLPFGEIYQVAAPAAYAGIAAYAVTSTPAACVTAAVMGAIGPRPDLVVSGINHGLNTGRNVMISGTVGAAMAASFWGIPALAVSQQTLRNYTVDWSLAAQTAARLLPLLLELPRTNDAAPVLNLNVPRRAPGIPRGMVQTRLGSFFYGQIIALDGPEEQGTRGRRLRYSFERTRMPPDESLETDDGAVHAGYISVTPLAPMAAAPLDLRAALEGL